MKNSAHICSNAANRLIIFAMMYVTSLMNDVLRLIPVEDCDVQSFMINLNMDNAEKKNHCILPNSKILIQN